MARFYIKKEYQSIADLYNIGYIKNISSLHRGYGGSAKYRVVTSKGKFIISMNVFFDKKDGIIIRSKESLQCEIDLLNFLKGMPVPHFKVSLNKNYIEKFKDSWITVCNFIPGHTPNKINSHMAYELGKFLGEFHIRSKKFYRNLDSRRKFYDFNNNILRQMKSQVKKQTNKILGSIVEEIEYGIKKNRPQSKLPVGPIHVDIGHNNELFQKNKLSGIIDFGNFYHGPFMIDVGKTIMWNCCITGMLDEKLFKSFIHGYKEKRRLNKNEAKYLKKSILYAIYSHIWVDLYHIPIKYVPIKWTLFLVKTFLPVARKLSKLPE